MIPELGHFATILALLVAIVQGVMPLLGVQRNNSAWIALARPAAQAQWLLVLVAFCCLSYAFYTNDFSVAYVAEHSNSKLPTVYRFAAVWGGHEGSLLLWVLLLATWTLAVSLLSSALPEAMVARVIGVLGLVSCGMLLFILTTSCPFERLMDIPADGNDLNPLLQDPGLGKRAAMALWFGPLLAGAVIGLVVYLQRRRERVGHDAATLSAEVLLKQNESEKTQ